MKRALKSSTSVGPACLLAALGLLLPPAGSGCASDDDCVSGTARVHVTLPGSLMGPDLTAKIQIANQTQVISLPAETSLPSGTGTVDVMFQSGYPAAGTPLVVQVSVSRPGAGGAPQVVATGLQAVEVAGGCFSVSINLLERRDGGLQADGGQDAGVPADDAALPQDTALPQPDAPPSADTAPDAVTVPDAPVDGPTDATSD